MDVIMEKETVYVGTRIERQLVSKISIVQWTKVLDAWCWMGEDTKVYTAQSGYKALLEEDVNIHFEGVGKCETSIYWLRKDIWLASIDG